MALLTSAGKWTCVLVKSAGLFYEYCYAHALYAQEGNLYENKKRSLFYSSGIAMETPK